MSAPFYGKEFTFTQPDGTKLRARGWGSQYKAVFETSDGFTIVKDPVTGFYQYASLTEHGDEFHPTGSRPGLADPRNLGLTPGLRISRTAAKAHTLANFALQQGRSRWRVRLEQFKMALRAAMAGPGTLLAPQRETVGDYVGLCLLIRFPDVSDTITQGEIQAFCNQPGYTGFGNHGSVYDYFFDNSLGKLRYVNIVTSYYTAQHRLEYYADKKIEYGVRAQELIREALDSLKKEHFDFSRLTSDNENHVYALNVFYAGDCVNNFQEGLWPHQGCLCTPYELVPGKLAYDYQITNVGSQLTLGTFCHENGHLLCTFPDLYDTDDPSQSNGIGVYCLMSYGGTNDGEKNPSQVCAYLKYRAGWAKVTQIKAGLRATIKAGQNEFFIQMKNASEYYIIENRYKAARDQTLPDSGLAIWHVDELGNNNNEQMTRESHYECSLVQADGQYDLEKGKGTGDDKDLFHSGGNDRFSNSTQPSSKWWDGTSSGMDVHSIGPSGQMMTFSADV